MATIPLWTISSLGTFIKKRKTKWAETQEGNITYIAGKHITTTIVCPPQLLIILGNMAKEITLVSSIA